MTKTSDILIIGGGIVPEKDIPELMEAGIAKIFGPGTPLEQIVSFIEETLEKGG